jgi:tetratricopeptide (TPR) repeat protein
VGGVQARADQAGPRIALHGARVPRNYLAAILALAILESESGRKVEAIRLYQEIIGMNPGSSVESEVNYRLAEIYVKLGKRREATRHLTTSVASAPRASGRRSRRSSSRSST